MRGDRRKRLVSGRWFFACMHVVSASHDASEEEGWGEGEKGEVHGYCGIDSAAAKFKSYRDGPHIDGVLLPYSPPCPWSAVRRWALSVSEDQFPRSRRRLAVSSQRHVGARGDG